MKSLAFIFSALANVNGQCCGAPVASCGAPVASCATCVAPVPAPPPYVPPVAPCTTTPPPPTCASFPCPAGFERNAYAGECSRPVCTAAICCKPVEGCEVVTAPVGWVKKPSTTCAKNCRVEDCFDPEPTCALYSCQSGKKITYAIPCPGGCTDALCCEPDAKAHTCVDFLATKTCGKYEVPRPDGRCSGSSCSRTDCCAPKPPPDCGSVTCPAGQISASPNRICGKVDRCTEADCCTAPRTCSAVQCSAYHQKIKFDGCYGKDCGHDDCCVMGPFCKDFNCGTDIKKHGGPCVSNPCTQDECCKEPPLVQTVVVPGPPPPAIVVPGPPAPPVYVPGPPPPPVYVPAPPPPPVCTTCSQPAAPACTSCGCR